MALKDYPEWVLKFKGTGKEIRFLNNKYYLYQVHTTRIDGKVKKFTDKYLGRITEDGLISPTPKNIIYTVKEFYSTVFIFNVCRNVIDSIVDRYKSKYPMYLSNAFFSSLLFDKDINKWNNSYISIIFPDFKITKHTDNVNQEISRITNMINHHINRFLNNESLSSFFSSISDIYMVGVKDNYTLAKISDNTMEILNKHNFNLEINYGKSK